MNRTTIWTLILSLALASATGAAPNPEQKCQAGKSKVAGKFYLCLQNAAAKYATGTDQTKVDAAFGPNSADVKQAFAPSLSTNGAARAGQAGPRSIFAPAKLPHSRTDPRFSM